MKTEEYKEKLQSFNDKKKYELENYFMRTIIDAKPNEKILDYGCGLGRMVWQLRMANADAYGYDVENLREHDNQIVFRNEYHFKFSKIYFMHSLNCIPKPEALFGTAFDTLLDEGGKVIIFSPNRDWLKEKYDASYVPDPHVFNQFNLSDLTTLFTSRGYEIEKQGQFGESVNGVCERIFFIATKV